MLNGMHNDEYFRISSPGRGHAGPGQGRTSGGADRLRSLLAAQDYFVATATELSAAASSPTEAAALALIIEQAHRRASYLQILAAQGARKTLAHELPRETLEQLSAAITSPAPFLAGEVELPADPATTPTGRLPHKDTADLLQHLLGTGYFEARDRVKAADALLPQTDVNGIGRAARYPQLSADAQAGTIDPRHAMQAARKLDKAAPVIRKQPDPAQLSRILESQVLESLHAQGPQSTGKLITAWQRTLEESAPGEPDAEEIGAKTGIFLTRRTEHFSYFSLCMLNVEAEIFLSHFANADNPRTAAGNREALARDAANRAGTPAANGSDNVGEDDDAPRLPAWAADPTTPVGELPRAAYTDLGMAAGQGHTSASSAQGPRAAEPSVDWQPNSPGGDGLTPARRRLQSILNVLRRVGESTGKNGKGLARSTLVVHCQLETLLGLAERAGITSHGLDVSPGELRRLLCDAGVLPIVFNSKSQILDLGREQRYVPDHIREAVLARDGGCLVPGCTVPPEHCEICHIDAWEDGGVTSAENSGPACSAHHHDFHSGKLGLVRDGNGLPAVLLPKYLDPEQLPRRNDHWQRRRQTIPTLF